MNPQQQKQGNHQERQPMESESQGQRKFGDKKDKNFFVGLAYKPVQLLAWLTGQPLAPIKKSKGEIIVLSILALGCAGLSVESWYAVMPSFLPHQHVNRKFIPKPYIDDGANIGNANPLDAALGVANMGLSVMDAMLPLNMKLRIPLNEKSIWLDPNFYLALSLSLALQIFQAKAVRSVSADVRKKRAEKANQFKTIDLSPDALMIAKVRTVEYNYSQVAGYGAMVLGIAVSFALEIGIGLSSLSSAQTVNGLAQLIYVFFQAFGFELFVNILLSMEEEDKL